MKGKELQYLLATKKYRKVGIIIQFADVALNWEIRTAQ